jgi:hypothetical protein
MAALTKFHEPQLHPALRPFVGQIIDADSHEMTPVQLWSKQFGADQRVVELADHFTEFQDGELINVPSYSSDDRAIAVSSIWSLKGGKAPGAVDPSRRTDVMDAMGVNRQLVFSSGPGHFGLFLHSDPGTERFLSGV